MMDPRNTLGHRRSAAHNGKRDRKCQVSDNEHAPGAVERRSRRRGRRAEQIYRQKERRKPCENEAALHPDLPFSAYAKGRPTRRLARNVDVLRRMPSRVLICWSASQRRLIGHGSAALQAEHTVAGGEALVAMRNHYDGRTWLEIKNGLDDLAFCWNIDCAHCFVEHEHERPSEHGAGKAQPLALAA